MIIICQKGEAVQLVICLVEESNLKTQVINFTRSTHSTFACTHLTENFENKCFEPLRRIELVARTRLEPLTSDFKSGALIMFGHLQSIVSRANFDVSKHIHYIDILYKVPMKIKISV